MRSANRLMAKSSWAARDTECEFLCKARYVSNSSTIGISSHLLQISLNSLCVLSTFDYESCSTLLHPDFQSRKFAITIAAMLLL